MKTASAKVFLGKVNRDYARLHKAYEELFWVSYMGDHSVDRKKDAALACLNAFRGDEGQLRTTEEIRGMQNDDRTNGRLNVWIRYFRYHQSTSEAVALKKQVDRLESAIMLKRSKRNEGYTDPHTGTFVPASVQKMRTMMTTEDDEVVRKACYEGTERLAYDLLHEYVEVVGLRNRYARALGYDDYYDLKVRREDGMTKLELFALFDSIYDGTRDAFHAIRRLEKEKPGLRKPWNFSYIMSGDFTKEEDPYLGFDEALSRWGRSFSALGITFRGGSLTLDLLNRKGKWDNGFCHWPELVRYEGRHRIPGSANFTCNVVAGQVGSGMKGYLTLFHEGGHAAHLLNASRRDVILNHEYAPMPMAWAETQSMFLEEIFYDFEWRSLYALNREGRPYPFDLFERKTRKLHPLRFMRLNQIMFVAEFEREIYEAVRLTPEATLRIAKRTYRKYFDQSEDSLFALNVPHILSSDSSASYHGYGLALLAVSQWREYFFRKYGYIVDNPAVGCEMVKVWRLGADRTFPDFVRLATGRKLSTDAFLKEVSMPAERVIVRTEERVAARSKGRRRSVRVRLDATIRMVDGKKLIADDSEGFESMCDTYRSWILRKSGN